MHPMKSDEDDGWGLAAKNTPSQICVKFISDVVLSIGEGSVECRHKLRSPGMHVRDSLSKISSFPQ